MYLQKKKKKKKKKKKNLDLGWFERVVEGGKKTQGELVR
jgi:hypothetical protein